MDGLRLIALSVPFQAAPLWLLPLDVGAPVLFAALLVSGIANGVCNPSIHSVWTLRMPARDPSEGHGREHDDLGLGMPLGLIVAGPVLSAFGTGPVLVGFAAVQTVCMLGVAAASLSARGRAQQPALAMD